ncbi:hypothetical protein [Bacillus xiapuensis]|uniref:hypothetical protein n=1 Tax=Bacillus xiapuensis TaxID=2014075 RepID=UPI001E62D1E8|nr:hypothetical protein [Bacillus xiapuensis]
MMRQVMNGLTMQTQTKEKRAVIRLELDYELAVLYEAMQADDQDQVVKSKEKLRKLRKQLLTIDA